MPRMLPLRIEIEGHADDRFVFFCILDEFSISRAGDDLIIGLYVVDGAEGDGDGRDGGMLRYAPW